MSERQVRLLYKTTCRLCGGSIAAGTATWWDDERNHATCTDCLSDEVSDGRSDGRSLEIMRAHRPRATAR